MKSRMWHSVKYEQVYLTADKGVAQAKREIAYYLAWYNLEREHSSLNKQTPDQAYWRWMQLPKAA